MAGSCRDDASTGKSPLEMAAHSAQNRVAIALDDAQAGLRESEKAEGEVAHERQAREATEGRGPKPRFSTSRIVRAREVLVKRSLAAFVLFAVGAAPLDADDAPWPAIRKARIQKLLPGAMQRARVDAWLVLCRENANDPLAMHVGGENAGAPAAFLFLLQGERVEAVALSPAGEALSLRDVGLHDRVEMLDRSASVHDAAAAELRRTDPKRIAINSSPSTLADGLSWTQRSALEKALGPELAARLVPSDDLVAEWLSVKPEEVEILRKAAALTAQLELEAYRTIVLGQTRDSDLARFLKKRMAELGVTDSWIPEQNPNVNSRPDRGHSHATDRLIQPGDFIQTDRGSFRRAARRPSRSRRWPSSPRTAPST